MYSELIVNCTRGNWTFLAKYCLQGQGNLFPPWEPQVLVHYYLLKELRSGRTERLLTQPHTQLFTWRFQVQSEQSRFGAEESRVISKRYTILAMKSFVNALLASRSSIS